MRVKALKSTTFSGRCFSRPQIFQVIDTVTVFQNLSRTELAMTICEHLDWKTPGNELKINSAFELLDKLESLGLCKPPAAKQRKRREEKPVSLELVSETQAISDELAVISPISLKIVDQSEDRQRFKSLMAKHHYLGYKRPFGANLGYFILDKDGRELGLLLFAASAWALKERDEWIGWKKRHRMKRLHLVVSNSRFLILPQVNVPNLASKVLSIVCDQLADDWHARYNYRPVMIETFVDRSNYRGTCYKAANWQLLGETAGQGRFGEHSGEAEAIKDLYVQPLAANFRDILLRGAQAMQIPTNPGDANDKLCRLHDKVLSFWSVVAPLIRKIGEEFDATWQVKRRVIDSMLLVLLIFRLVATRAKQGYGTTIDELWDNCRRQGLPLPQKRPIAASAFTVARRKLDEQIFKTINSRILTEYKISFDKEEFRYHGHRLFAVDGTRINLPRQMFADGFVSQDKKAHYPLGLFSCLYQLRAQIPVDFTLVSLLNERVAALTHLKHLEKGDVVIYDRGYFGYGFLQKHIHSGINVVFRLITNSTSAEIEEFVKSSDIDRIITLEPTTLQQQRKLWKSFPGAPFEKLTFRLIKYEINGNLYCLGTTLLDQRYSRESIIELYHGRWGIEELYKISKHFIAIEEFHAKCLRGVKQELYAQMAMITLNRILTNHTDDLHRMKNPIELQNKKEKRQTNFKSCLAVTARNLECLLLHCAENMKQTLLSVLAQVFRHHQAERPNRSYPRRSMKPRSHHRKKPRREWVKTEKIAA